jgi:hypothetical protein
MGKVYASLSSSWFWGIWFQFFQFCMMLAKGFSYTAFIVLWHFPSIPFITKWGWILSKAFSASIEMIRWFLALLLLICCNTCKDLHMLNHLCVPGKMSTWSWWMIWYVVRFDLSLFYWGFLPNILLGDWLVVLFFFGCVLVWFWDKYNTGFIEWVRQHSNSFYIMEKMKKYCC